MAYDKVIDSSVLDANLTSVANAIRSKGGSSASLAFPAGFINAISQIETGKVTTEVHDFTFASDLGSGTNTEKTLLTANDFVKANYAKAGFAVVMFNKSPIPMTAATVMHGAYHGNMNIGASDSVRYGIAYKSNSASALGMSVMTAKVSGDSYNMAFRAKSTGNLNLFVGGNLILKAGTYRVILICWEG